MGVIFVFLSDSRGSDGDRYAEERKRRGKIEHGRDCRVGDEARCGWECFAVAYAGLQ